MTTTITSAEKNTAMNDTTSPAAEPIEGAVDQAADTPPDAPDGPLTPDRDEADQSDTESRPGREAARYRRQLREVEADRDQLRTVVSSLQKAEAERLAGAAKLKPAALWASGVQLADLLTENGTVDAALVAAAIATAKDVLGISGPPAAPPASGQGNVGSPVGTGAGPTWDSVLRGR
jgi:hypothetical protein